jgi:NNMT/PNMT/TEMT family protein
MTTARLHTKTGRWALTLAATVVSTCAADVVATTAGVVLVASAVLHGLDHGLLLVFLAGTYVLWGAGLRVNLAANSALLEDTGTSTNALSKAAYDLAKLRTPSLRARRLAAVAGYVATELAKEVPYYAGAFGTAVLSESIDSNDALIFLGGANLGVAAYEYALARITKVFLHMRSARVPYASFDTDWVPKEYLTDYYSVVEPDERETIAFFVAAMKHVKRGEPILFFGVGPTLHHVFLAAGRASEIHLADYLPANLREIERWIERDPDAHDWRAFVRYTLECEGLSNPTAEEIRQREEITRAKITRLLQVDAARVNPLGRRNAKRYATVISAYCADSATDDRATWEAFMRHISDLVAPGGTFVTAALRRCRFYLVGGKPFPSANVDEHDIGAVLEPEFGGQRGSTEVRHLPEHEALGYSGIVLAWARRRQRPMRRARLVPRTCAKASRGSTTTR